jgi:hypothetical protein
MINYVVENGIGKCVRTFGSIDLALEFVRNPVLNDPHNKAYYLGDLYVFEVETTVTKRRLWPKPQRVNLRAVR